MPDGYEVERGRFEGQILFRLDAIDRRLNEFSMLLHAREELTRETFKDLEARLRLVEQSASQVKVVASALAVVAGLVSSIAIKLLG